VIRFILLLLFQTIFAGFILAQSDTSSKMGDSLKQGIANRASGDSSTKIKRIRHSFDSLPKIKIDSLHRDSIATTILKDTEWAAIAVQYPGKNFILHAYQMNKFFGFSSSLLSIASNKKEFKGKEILFYTLVALLLFFAFIKFSFPKYLGDLFRVAFRTTLKQRQIGEQLIQTPLPSLLLNFFFLAAVAFYISFVLEHYQLATDYGFWLLYFYCFVALAVIYVIKFLSLKFFGWLFNIRETTDGYIFIVFMINKIIGIYVLPFLILLAFTDKNIYQVAFALSYIGIFGLLGYRFILSYGLVRTQIRVNPFHFFLYLCAFEFVPLLLIYKALLLWF
jgi:hypothetical protein